MELVIPVDRLPDSLLSSGLEILAGLCAPSPTDNNLGGTAFMAAYLSPSTSGSPLVEAVVGPSLGALAALPLVSGLAASSSAQSMGGSLAGLPSVSGLLAPSPAQFVGGSSATLAWLSVPPPISSGWGPSGGPVDPGGLSPPLLSSSVNCMGGSGPPSSGTPVHNPYARSSISRHTDPGSLRGGFHPQICPATDGVRTDHTTTATGSVRPSLLARDDIPALEHGQIFPSTRPDGYWHTNNTAARIRRNLAEPPPASARRPDPEEEVYLSPPSCQSSLPSSVSFGEHQSISSAGGYHGGHLSTPLVGGYQGGRSSSSSSCSHGSHGGRLLSIPLSVHPVWSPVSTNYNGLVNEATVDDLSISTSRTLITGGHLAPIPVPSDRFILAPIKSGEDYLQQRDVLLFWLRANGFSTARSDDLLLTDSTSEARLWLAIAIFDQLLCLQS